MKRYVAVLLWLLLLSAPGLERRALANMSTGRVYQSEREVVLCYFGALRKDGSIMVNMVPGAAGKVYQASPSTPVMLNGASVGLGYLQNGMPIVLFLNGQKSVDRISIRTAGGE